MNWVGASDIQDGITIDLTDMQGIEVLVRDGSKIAKIGPGATMSDVYRKLGQEGLVVPGLLAGNVGVGGFLLDRW
jgi:FAD/FMN-containing dehydrogenase